MVVCIAGHVDHGKTSLVKALTGIDTDRLPEEKKRDLTIDIGFALLKTEGINQISLVDLPGHERFATNMLCGVLGCNGAILCVDLTEGVKPQTLEHIQILSLLKMKDLICVLTKKDLVDELTITQRKEEISNLLNDYQYINVPLITVSSKTEEGIPELSHMLTDFLKNEDVKNEDWFLPIDRVWISKEKGVIITGTLQGGSLKIKDKGLLVPKKEEAWVKGLEQHGIKKEIVNPSTRVAIMLGKREGKDLKRGNLFCKTGVIETTDCFDGEISWLNIPKHACRIRLSIGTENMGGKLILIPNQKSILQLRLDKKIGVKKNMPFILRAEGSLELLGGGKVIVPNAIKRRIMDRRVGVGRDLSEDIINLLQHKPLQGEIIRRRIGATPQEFSGVIEILKNQEKVLGFEDLWYVSEVFKAESQRLIDVLNEFHQKNLSIAWVKREEILKKTDLNWKGKVLDQIIRHLKNQDEIKVKGSEIALATFSPQLKPKQQNILDKVKSELERSGLETSYPSVIAKNLDVPLQALEEILKLGKEVQEILHLPQNIYYTRAQYESILILVHTMNKNGFSLGEFKEKIGTSRKYALAILEYLDNHGITMRLGEIRVVKRNP